nr:transcriptional regulator [uncultured Flavobacterium sp.]
MNYIKHLSGFFDKVANDKTLNPTHVSLYMSLFQFWNCNRFKNPISISRNEVMRISKISSKATYHKCLKNLHSLGYINYEPSHNPFKGSHVFLLNFSEELKPMLKKNRNLSSNSEPVFGLATEQLMNNSYTSTETSTEQVLVPYINNTNNTNNTNNLNILNLEAQAKKNENDDGFLKNEATQKKEKSSAKKEKKEMTKELLLGNSKIAVPAFADTNANKTEKSRQKGIAPKMEEVKSYFLNQNFPKLEANKFFNYFSSVGWLVGGKTPMVDWQAAAQNWILNAPKFKHNTNTTPIDRAKHLNTENDKDYGEPL